MDETTRKVDVNVNGHPGFAALTPIGTFVFTILCFAFWALDLGMLPEGSQMAIGFLGFAAFIPYILTGLNLARLGIGFGANTYLVFGAVFGACNGMFNTFTPLLERAGIPFNYSVFGIALLTAGIYMIFMLPGAIRSTKADFFIFLFAAIGVTTSGLTVLGWVPPFFNYINGWAMFLDGVAGAWGVIGIQLNSVGIPFPLGKPFVE